MELLIFYIILTSESKLNELSVICRVQSTSVFVLQVVGLNGNVYSIGFGAKGWAGVVDGGMQGGLIQHGQVGMIGAFLQFLLFIDILGSDFFSFLVGRSAESHFEMLRWFWYIVRCYF